ncbi:MAG: Crp/Fnr family transcriptional regulator, partial [Breznakibacter sp.]|nr:Crp/Fnr family transcriptional regulator [Breznakibacter sp.]
SDELACTTTKVINDALLCYLPGDALTSLIKTNSEFAMALMKLTCKELGESNKFLTDIAQKTVRERLAEVLLLLMDTFDLDEDNTLRISLTREELANMVGTATESVIRLLSEFKADKLIELNGRKIKLLNIPKLIKTGNVYV